MASPVFGGKSFAPLILSKLLWVNFTVLVSQVDAAFNDVSFSFHELILSDLEPLGDCAVIR